MITSLSRIAHLAAAIGIPLAVAACASTPPARQMTAHADTGTHSDASSPRTGAETPQQASNAGSVRISDEILNACGIGRGDAFFSYDSYSLHSKDIAVLNKVATCFKAGPLEGRSMKLVGHADPRGASEYNMTLGMNRADSVAGYLHRQGVMSSQTETTSRGAMDAVGTNESTWAQDRRVDVMLGQ